VEVELRRRRFGKAVRIEVEAGVSENVLGVLLDELDLTHEDVTYHRSFVDLTGLFVIHGLARDIPLTAIYRGVAPFVFADTFRLAVLVLFPALTLWLPQALK